MPIAASSRGSDERVGPVGGDTPSHDRLQLLLLALPVVVLLVMAWSHRWVTEDAYINFRVIDQIEAGHGPVLNAGERVEAVTSPLWVFLVTVAHNLVLRRFDLAWITVVLGIGLAAWGLTAAIAASSRVAHATRRGGRLVPFGALVIAVLPPVWDFATSGLETGLVMAWLGSCQLALASRYRDLREGVPPPAPVSAASPRWLAALIGAGLLIRPDLAPFCLGFGLVLWWSSSPDWAGRVRSIGWALAAPLLYELFRAGYYASLVPNTALAKDATGAHWGQGLMYLSDVLVTYLLIIPLVALARVAATWPWHGPGGRRDGALLALVMAPMAAALLQTLYVVRIGGDFMHGRFLVPALFAFAMPLAAEALGAKVAKPTVHRIAVAVVAVWSVICLVSLRTPYGAEDRAGITNERDFWIHLTGSPHPITVDDYSRFNRVRQGREYAARAAAGEDVLILAKGQLVPLEEGAGVVAVTDTIGLLSTAAGLDVHIVDLRGLGDVLAARTTSVPGARIGHEKAMADSWSVARFAPPEADAAAAGVSAMDVAAARRALACGPIASVFEDVTDDLTLERFAENLVAAPANTRVQVPADPRTAAMACPPGS